MDKHISAGSTGQNFVTVRTARNPLNVWIEQDDDSIELDPEQAQQVIEALENHLRSV